MKKKNALDVEYLEQILDGKAERKDEGSKKKDRRQVCRNNCERKEKKLTYA